MLTKGYVHGTHRLCDPEATWARVRPLLDAFGITRVADITRLDYVGVPTWLSVRPNSRCLAVSQGKGLTPTQARVSAVMESIESWHAEHVTLPRTVASHRALRARALDPARLNLVRNSFYHEDLALPWVEGRDLLGERPVHVPYDLVHTCFLVSEVHEPPCFLTSSNGLASGNHALEATSHALCELIERDSSSLWLCRNIAGRAEDTWLDLETVRDPACRWLLDLLGAADMAVEAWDETSDLGVPSVGCRIFERQPRSYAHPVRLAAGYGCHLAPETALVRALTEAVQSRLTAISGARDDLYRQHYAAPRLHAAQPEAPSPVAARRGRRDFAALPSLASDSLEEDVRRLLACLERAGVGRVAVVDLSRPEYGVPVVRAVVHDLEHLGIDGQFRRYGPRARRVLQGA